MNDRLARSEVEVLREEVDLLSNEVERLTEAPPKKVSLWRRIFGHLIYDGPETCGHCKYWIDLNHPQGLEWTRQDGEKRLALGDCKLLCGRFDKTYKESCDRFMSRRRYKRRVRD